MNTAEILQFPSESGGQERRVVDMAAGEVLALFELTHATRVFI